MSEPISLYISAAADLMAERESLGRAVAEMPVDLPWQITHSPLKSEPLEVAIVAQADIHLLLLGSDIRAPIGQEWSVARRAGRSPHLFLKEDINRTSAGLDFVRFAGEVKTWQRFMDAADLRPKALKIIARYTYDQAERYALSSIELDRLNEWRLALDEEGSDGDETRQSGAGESGLIFSRSRYVPGEGILIEHDDTESNEHT